MKSDDISYVPKLFNLAMPGEMDAFTEFRKNNPDIAYIDTLGEQKHELSIVKDPSLITHEAISGSQKTPTQPEEGVWVFFPWRRVAVRILAKEEYDVLRLSRNKDLITKEEQEVLKNKTIAIAGLNVGNPGAVCLALEGIADNIKLSDLDPLSLSNLNRFRASLVDLDVNKAHLSARQIFEINPYANIEMYDDGINLENIDRFLNEPKVDLLIEEIDNLRLKITLRERAKHFGIPVVMVTGTGEGTLVDVERYDLDKDLPILNGYLNQEVVEGIMSIKPGEGTFRERVNLAKDFVGKEYLEDRLVDSFDKVGVSLASIPQLAESSFIRGAVITNIVKRILLNEKVESGRYHVSTYGEKLNK